MINKSRYMSILFLSFFILLQGVMLGIVSPAKARSNNAITVVPSVSGNHNFHDPNAIDTPGAYNGAIPFLRINNFESATSGQVFRLVLPQNVKWNRTIEYTGEENDTPEITLDRFRTTVTNDVYASLVNDRILEVTLNDLTNEDVLKIPMDVVFFNVDEGAVHVVIDGMDSPLTSGKYTFANVVKSSPPTDGETTNGENRPPVANEMSNPNWSLYIGVHTLEFRGSNLAQDTDGDPLIISNASSSDPNIVSLDTADGVLKITPLKVGNASVIATISDGRGGMVTATPINITVKEAYLLSIIVSGEKGVITYNKAPFSRETVATVTSDVYKVTVTANARDSGFNITINGDPLVSGQASNPITLTDGENKITLSVTDLEGNSKDFPITINRSSDNNGTEKRLIVTKIPVINESFDGEASTLIIKNYDQFKDGDVFNISLSEGIKWNSSYNAEGSITNAKYKKTNERSIEFAVISNPEELIIPLNIKVYKGYEGEVKGTIESAPNSSIPNGQFTFAYVVKTPSTGEDVDYESPTNITVSNTSKSINSVTLSMSASDSSGIKEFHVYRDDNLLAKETSNIYNDSNLSPGTLYKYKIKAVDNFGNVSDFSSEISVTTEIDECFIATAAYGSKFEPSVTLLRDFRDKYLLTNSIGKMFVEFYYTNSPPIAKIIADSESLKLLVRVLLAPIVGVVYLIFHPSIIGLIFGILMIAWQRKKMKIFTLVR